MRHIKPYQVFEASDSAAAPALTEEQIKWLDKCAAGRWKLNRKTGLVDVKGIFDCRGQGLRDFKGVKFGKVSGDFSCPNNQLTSLVGAPQTVGRFFNCIDNVLTSLEGAPQSVKGGFLCRNNQLTSLVGAPQSVGGDFLCENNQLTSLVGAPQDFDGIFRCISFDCSGNQLTSLVGAPQSVWDFHCENNQLTSLEGAPQAVGKSFYCQYNQLTSLVGAPQSVGFGFYCEGNQLTSLEGAPHLTVYGGFYFQDNPVSVSTLKAISALMKKEKPYQQALEEYWPKMKDVDRALMYKDHPSLTPEDARKYKALAIYGNIKNYL